MGLLSIPELVTKAKAAFKRFPLTLLWAFTGSLLVAHILEVDNTFLFRIVLVASVGSWVAYTVSIRSQIKIFEELYDNAFAKAQTQNKVLPQQEYNRLRSTTRFLADRDVLVKTSTILGYVPSETFKNISKWQLPYKIIDTLGLDLLNGNHNNSRIYFYSDNNQTIVLNNADYYKAVDILSTITDTPFNTIYLYQIRLSESRDTPLVSQDKEVYLRLPLQKMITHLRRLNQNSNQVPRKKFMVQGRNKSLEAIVYFQSISLDNDNLNKLENYSRADVFLNELEK